MFAPPQGSYGSETYQGQENFGNFSNGMPTLQRSFRAIKGRGFGDGPVRTRGPESLVGQGPSGTYREYGDFSVGVQGPMPMMQTAGPESIESINRQNQEQYIPVPPGKAFQKATYGTPGLPGIPQMGTAHRKFNPPQQRGGMFNQQNQFNPQGMQQMMQFMQQMMQMFSMMGGQNGGGGFGGQQQYQQPQRYQPQQYQPPPRQQFQPVQQQYGQMGPQQPNPFAQSIRPRY